MTVVAKLMDAEEFLQRCRTSSSVAYDCFVQLLARLEQAETRIAARQSLHAICQRYLQLQHEQADLKSLNFSFGTLAIGAAGETERQLELLQFPSSFSPEEWSFTFYEGLTRYTLSEFHERCVVELGCGNGWISLALAVRCLPKMIYGVDINPKAVVLSKLNLYLNALDADGQIIHDIEGKSLLDRVTFAESDLLSWFFVRNAQQASAIIPDIIVGCIPQVLNPDPDALLTIAPESDSDEHLYALSNYCDKQGYIEDQFGLGLIARALEESVMLLRPTGKLIFNLGGRPGEHVLERMFLRRGFNLKKVWQTKVNQAQDTDILALVNIEQSSPHRFEFYMSRHSDEPISATTAWRYAQQDGSIFHALTVYEADLAFPVAVRTVLQHLQGDSYEQARSSLDLSYDSKEIAEERMSFLADLASRLAQPVSFPYLDTEGDWDLRQNLALYLRSYFYLDVRADLLLIAPTRADILRNIIEMYRPSRVLMDQQLARVSIDSEGLRRAGVELIEAPRRVESCCRLMMTLQPQMVVTALAEFEHKSPEAFARLIEQSGSQNCLLLVDISDMFDLSSSPSGNGVFQYLATHQLPEHVALICGLVKNRVYTDLEVCFVLTRNELLLQQLSAAAELTYSRTPSLNQHYYSRLLKDLLYFQRPQRHHLNQEKPSEKIREDNTNDNSGILFKGLPLTANVQKAFAHPAITTAHLPMNAETTRLDYGENCLAAPQTLKAALLESFVRQHISADELNLDSCLLQLLESRYGLSSESPGRFVYGSGIAPLFASLCQLAVKESAIVFMPQGGYDMFAAAADFYGVRCIELPTSEAQLFKVEAGTLASALELYVHANSEGRSIGRHKLFVYLNGPIVNPTGSCYSSDELNALLDVAHHYSATIILDTVFSGLEFSDAMSRLTLGKRDERPLSKTSNLLLLGGVSKEFAAGGLRFGYAYSQDRELVSAMAQMKIHQPHSTLFYTFKRLYQGVLAGNSMVLAQLSLQKLILRERAERMRECLTECGWSVLPSSGGLFMVANPIAYVGKVFSAVTPEGERQWLLDSNNIDHAMFYGVNLLINNAVWTGLPGYCRFVLSVSDQDFNEGIEKIRRFHQMVFSQ